MVPEDWARPTTASNPRCCTISGFPTGGRSSPRSGAGIPINGSSLSGVGNYAGDIFFYGFGPSYQLVNRENIKFAPVVELFGWHVLGGLETVETPARHTGSRPMPAAPILSISRLERAPHLADTTPSMWDSGKRSRTRFGTST